MKEPLSHQATWTYLLKQHYINLIEIDIFTIHEKRHLLDVKRVFETTYKLWFLFFILSTAILLVFIIKIKSKIITLLRYIYILGLTLNSLLILLMFNFLVNFNFFHTLIFSKNSWTFPKNSTIIEWFPLHYFQEFIMIFLILSFFILFLIRIISSKLRKKRGFFV